MRTGVIYGLCDPETLEIRYVGLTRGSVAGRINKHVWAAGTGRSRASRHFVAWLRSLPDRPVWEILEEDIPEEDLPGREVAWIAALRAWGVRLTNGTLGGEGVRTPDPETRHRKGSANRGRPLSASHRAALSRAQLRRFRRAPVSAETRKRLSEASKRRGALPPWHPKRRAG